MSGSTTAHIPEAVAIIGMSCRFPGASTIEAYWQNLRAGVESIRTFSDSELLSERVPADLLQQPDFVKALGVLDDVMGFDGRLFGFSPRESDLLDPQQRLFLECAWEALESAGYPPISAPGAVGVYAGVGAPNYLLYLFDNPTVRERLGFREIVLANQTDHFATRVGYKLDLRGPCITVQTTCSTSLVSIVLACQGLLDYQCDVALAGGSSLQLSTAAGGYLYREGDIFSPDGHCRAFDAAAAGTVPSSGAGVVVLKRLSEAVADGDTIHAIIRGTAVNNDGAGKVGFTAPSVGGQAEVIAAAQADAGVTPDDISYIEAHGTGTILGDPIEIAALTKAFRTGTDRRNFCAIGSVKTNFGHLDAAAGVAGLIKTTLALQHREIPPSLHFTRPNPKLGLEDSPFFVNTELRPWPAGPHPRLAGVSSFGIGGTNAHVVLEEAPVTAALANPTRPSQLLVLSAATASALEQASANLAIHFENHENEPLADVAYTLQVGRTALAHRRVLVSRGGQAAVQALRGENARQQLNGQAAASEPHVAFLFPGQGAQHVGMTREIYAHEPLFRAAFDRCCALLQPHLGLDLRDVIHAPGAQSEQAALTLQQTALAQPALFAIEYSLAEWWRSVGVEPQAMLGHSIGEYVAACVAGVFSLEDGLALVAARGRLMQSLAPGAMLAVPLSEDELGPLLNGDVALAAVNSELLCVASGTADAIQALEVRLAERELSGTRLHTSHAFHSNMMEPILDMFAEQVAAVRLSAPRIPFISNVTGTWITTEQATDPRYWASHLRSTVRFADGLDVLVAQPDYALLEVGPGQSLTRLAAHHPARQTKQVAVASLPHPADKQSDLDTLLTAVGQLWVAGRAIDWAGLHPNGGRRVVLPTYPFERQRHWIDVNDPGQTPVRQANQRTDPTDWLYAPAWRRTGQGDGRAAAALAAGPAQQWLVLCDELGWGERLRHELERAGQRVIRVYAGTGFERLDQDSYRIDPRRPEAYGQLLDELRAAGVIPNRVLHLWSLSGNPAEHGGSAPDRSALDLGFYSLLFLGQALGEQPEATAMEVTAISNGLHVVVGDELVQPEKAALLGPCRVMPKEFPQQHWRSIDIGSTAVTDASGTGLVEHLLDELTSAPRADEPVLAYRAGYRWTQTYGPVRDQAGSTARQLRELGVYLITGGLGGVGLALAEYLARTVHARLALVGRSAFPQRAAWPMWLETHAADDPTSSRIRQIQGIESNGGEVYIEQADITDPDAAVTLINRVKQHFGGLHGIIHAAGTLDDGIVSLKTAHAAQRVLAPKVEGTFALAAAVRDEPLDFVVLCSSISAITGPAGQVDYCAANAVMDAFANGRAARGDRQLVSINWDAWADAGMWARTLAEARRKAPHVEIVAEGLRNEEGAQALVRALALGLPQVVISTRDFAALLNLATSSTETPQPTDATQTPHSTVLKFHSRPTVSTAYEPPRNDLEARLVAIWREVLGIDQIGINDNFFALGGESLIALRVVARAHDAGLGITSKQFYLHPTIAELAELVFEAVPPTERGAQGGAYPAATDGLNDVPLVPIPRTESLPLSFAQQRLWFLDQLEPESPRYNIYLVSRLRGRLDVAALQHGLNGLVQRHESLRTCFPAEGGLPTQRIASELTLALPCLNLEAFDVAAQAQALDRELRLESRQPFDLSHGPLVRARLVRRSADDHVMLLSMHHSVADGWSLGVLGQELGELYSANVEGRAADLRPVPIQYADFAVWQRAWLQGERLEQQLAYWREQLRGAPTLLELPTDHLRPSLQSDHGGAAPVEIVAEVTRALHGLAAECGSTLYMVLLAAFQTLLHRYTGQDDLLVASPIAGRPRPELERVIGFFVNTLVLRGNLGGDPSFRDLLERTRETALKAYAHQDVPFEKLVDELQLERDLSRHPLVQVMCVLQNAPLGPIAMTDMTLEPVDAPPSTSKLDLSLELTESAEGLRGMLQYDAALFERETIERLVRHFQTLVEGIAANPDTRLSQLPLLSPAERHLLIEKWNRTDRPYNLEQTVPELFAQQVARTPDAVAVVFEDQSLTYAQLDARANQLAHHLRGLGVGPETLVGICAERSMELVVGLLGILKAGGAYVPLDPSYPTERLAFMLQDADVRVLLSQAALVGTLPAHQAQLVCLDVDAMQWADQPTTAPDVELRSDHLAYMIYTSGSTGRPKGAMNEHRGIVNRLLWMQETYGLTAADRVLQKTPFSFDVSVWEFFWPLVAGSRLVVARPEGHRDPAYLRRVIAEQGITTLHFVPSMLQVFVQEPALGEACASVRRVVCSGEALSAELQAKFFEELPHIELHNLYGPTEAAVDVTAWACAAEASARSVPIGRPIANTQIYILDAHQQPVPTGVPGELYIGGVQVGRGYLNRLELTAEKFIADPFKPSSSAWLYRTGDLARWRADGVLEYLGRLDFQVKVRGNRIELGEIESRLLEHPDVREAVVLARADRPGDMRLVAYLVPSEGQAVSTERLRAYLKQRLPEYMVPSAFIQLPTLPLSPNGKLDRRALPLPETNLGDGQPDYVAPRTPTESVLAGIWAEVLGIDLISIHDNFFELGGHSLLATRVVARVRQTFGVDLSVRSLFDSRTVAELAHHLQAARARAEGHDEVPLISVSRAEPLPLSFAQQRLWFLDKLEPNSTQYNIPAAVRLRGALDEPALRQSLHAVVQRHESLRTSFPTHDGAGMQCIAPELELPLPCLDLQTLAPTEQALALEHELQAEVREPFDLQRGPLVRARLVRLANAEHVLLLSLHHSVADGWSLGVLWNELATLYTATVQNRAADLPPLPIQYADYAVWQRALLQGERLERELRYWRRQLDGAPTVFELPGDRARPSVQSYRADTLPVSVNPVLTKALRRLAADNGSTLFMVLMAALQTLLQRHSGQDDLLIAAPIAGRSRPELEGLIGFFVNTLVLRGDLGGDPTFRELLERTRETALEAYAHQDVPFEKLVNELGLARDLSHNALVQVMFILQNAPLGSGTLLDLTVEPVDMPVNTTKMDLTLELTEPSAGLQGSFQYDADLFERETIERLAGHFQTLLEGIAANPDTRLSQLPLLSPAERYLLIEKWNRTDRPYNLEQTVPELFAQQVARTPDAVAVVFDNQSLTFAQLDARANQLAHHLRSLGVGPETLVGICAERSMELVVALLGILKAGGAYLPLDPSYPTDRLAFMLDDAHLSVLLTHAPLDSTLPPTTARLVRLDADAAHWADLPTTPPTSELRSDNLAYVIYTSGSTGRPKGVQITHRALTNFLSSMHAQPGISPTDVLLAVTTLSFDIAGLELWLPLISGARLVLAPRDVSSDGKRLRDLIESSGTTILQATPATWRLLIEAEWPGAANFTALCGGEALARELAIELLARCGHVWNMYGPTETTIWSTCQLLQPNLERVLIGRPIANTQVYVLDQQQQPTPLGVPGELYIGGQGVARGYLNRPELTAERFVHDPFTTTGGARMYRTGDLVRYNRDGTLEYLGRLDNQVKVRGFRIELGEIEATLDQHPDVRQAVVLARQDRPGDTRLVAYLVTEPHRHLPPVEQLRAFVQQRLPTYMVPAAFVTLDQLPTTPNGKVDRRALPAPDGTRPELETKYVAPVTVTEQTIAAIWRDTLNIEHVGVHDNFFDLGGDSMLTLRVQGRLELALGRNISVVELFQFPTVSALARHFTTEPETVSNPQAKARGGRQRAAVGQFRPVPRRQG